jgi:hypothetical protein
MYKDIQAFSKQKNKNEKKTRAGIEFLRKKFVNPKT